MADATGHTGIQHLYKIVNLFFLIHDSLLKALPPLWEEEALKVKLLIKINLDVACEYLILFSESSGDDGEGIGDTILCIIERKLGYR